MREDYNPAITLDRRLYLTCGASLVVRGSGVLRRAFTMVSVMVVVGVITILAAAGPPVRR
jgi:hypothetical protein